LLDGASLSGADRATPLHLSAPVSPGTPSQATRSAWQANGDRVTAATLPPAAAAPRAARRCLQQRISLQPIVTLGARWIIVPVTNGIAAMGPADNGGSLSLERVWAAQNPRRPRRRSS
jgi:hypothetical protein